jgi:hypothetical protein
MQSLIVGFGSNGKRHYDILINNLGKRKVFIVSRREISIENSFHSLKDISDIDDYNYFVISTKIMEHFEDLKYINSKVNNKIILVGKFFV